ncbi:MAG: endonuclease/exonuclease/phosphatase family protein [Phycisphaerales bacterium]
MVSKSRHSGLIGRTTRVVALLFAMWSVLWVFAGHWMLFDVLLSFQAQVLALAAVFLVGFVILRRWRFVSMMALVCLVGGWPLVNGRGLVTPAVNLTTEPEPGALRVVSYNINPKNDSWREDLDVVFSWEPDVVVLIEVSPDLWRAIVRRGEFDDSDFPYHVRRAWVGELSSPCFVLSRWPIEKLSFPDAPDFDRDVCIAEVSHPEGAFLIGAIHPHSPRTLLRWRRGNQQLFTTVEAVVQTLESSPLPYIAGIDLNSGPAGARAGVLRSVGLSMCKPWFGGWGSFPMNIPAIGRVQLDDVWRSPGVEVVGWSSPRGLSSDHSPVVVDVRLPR